MSHVFKNVTFSDVGCTLCNEPHNLLDCPSLHSIIEMEVSSSASPNDISSSSDSSSCSPDCDYSSRRRCYRNGSRSTSRLPRCFDRGYSLEIDYSQGRDYRYHSPDRNNNYRDRQYNPSYYDRRYNNSNGFSKLGAIVRIVNLINIKTGHFPITTRLAIIVADQIIITTIVMIGTRGPNVLERVSPATNSSSIATIKLDESQ